jgi:AcrR family transcriptional regulator
MPEAIHAAHEASPATPTRRARKKARTRRDIYAAAMALFVARGFDAVTIDDICAAADVARGTFFLHFPTKDAVLGEYGREVTAELADRLRTHRGSAAAALRLAFRMLVGRAVKHAEVVRLMVRELMAHPAALADATAQGRDFGELIAGLVRDGQRTGEFRRAVDARLAAAVIVSSYFAIVNEWAREAVNFDLEAGVSQALDLVLRGLSARR